MDCPYCGEPMRAGVIRSRDHLKWYAGDAEWGDSGIRLSEMFQEVRAFYCPDCRRVVIPVPEVESVWDKMQRKLNAASEKIGAMQEQWEARQTQAKKEKKKEKLGAKDPWEL